VRISPLIFAAVLALTGNSALFAAQSSSTPASACRSADPEIRRLQQRAESSPFYKAAQKQYGDPKSCATRKDDLQADISYKFGDDASLDILTNPEIEFSEQHLHIRGISAADGLSLLKNAEKDSYQPHGCGIDWDHPVSHPSMNDTAEKEPEAQGRKSREVAYEGNVCNCEASIVYDGDAVVELILRSAC
jgi:hypothetical protein